jgi:hypothetical protein
MATIGCGISHKDIKQINAATTKQKQHKQYYETTEKCF